MPYFSRRLLLSLSPFVNLDLFKKGHYHISAHLTDKKSDQSLSRIECLEIRDLFGPQLSEFTYPGACQRDDHFITQTILVEYSEQSFALGECFIFKLDSPVRCDHTDAFLPSHLSLTLQLRFSGDEELPKDPSSFVSISTRTLEFTIDWRKGLHDHFPVLFDYFHMAAVGATVHASLFEFCLDDFPLNTLSFSSARRRSIRGSVSGRRWSTVPSNQTLPSLSSVLFGRSASPDATTSLVPPGMLHPLRSFSLPAGENESSRKALYLVPEKQILRAQDAHQMLCDLLCSARDSLYIGKAIMSNNDHMELTPVKVAPPPRRDRESEARVDNGGDGGSNSDDDYHEENDISKASTLEEAEALCCHQLSRLNARLANSWDWFCTFAVVQPELTPYLATLADRLHKEYSSETIVSTHHPLFRGHTGGIEDPLFQSTVAAKIRKTLSIPMTFFCKENVETSLNTSVVFIEPPPWPVLEGGARHRRQGDQEEEAHRLLDDLPGTIPGLEGFTRYVPPYLTDTANERRPRAPEVHLVVCVHGLQGNQFDLRLYRIFLTMALPQVRFSFLMAASNQADTFCDFNLMTDRLMEEVMEHVRNMATPPSKISFIGHSLGSIVVRSLVTRPEFASLHPKLHLYLSICGPHLGTKYQNGLVSVGMWAVRKWYSSKSLLQLSLKDAPNPYDSFLYQLSEAPSLECFRHVILLASPQDKYVPYHSAKVTTLSRDASFQSDVSLHMIHNILEPMRKAHVNLVRISVDHSIPTSANSVIGRAAHIAMLDNELFIEKLVSLHLTQYFLES